jgi:polyhydroxybutyrate depolymerase
MPSPKAGFGGKRDDDNIPVLSSRHDYDQARCGHPTPPAPTGIFRMRSTHLSLATARLLGLAAVVLGLLLSVGCDSNSSNAQPIVGPVGLTGCADTDSCAPNPTLQIGGDRPAQVSIPSDYTPTTRYPLIIVLHGYGANGDIQANYLGLYSRVDSSQYVLVVPDGTESLNGTRFWNATPACCARVAAYESQVDLAEYTGIDDVAYIRGLIEEAAATYSIDVTRIGLFGHSNGGFMALRMVCEASDIVTSVVSLAGSTFADPASCAPADHPVSVLLLHGDQDATIAYDGGEYLSESYPGAIVTADRFAAQAGCDSAQASMGANRDVVGNIEGPETTVTLIPDCAPGVEVELWTMVGAPHIPFPWVPEALDSFVDWIIDHPRP